MDAGNEQSADSARGPYERIGVAGVWCRDGQVLLTRRAPGIPYGNLWCFPGGGIEPGEDEVTALQREWREELGAAVRVIRKIGSSDVAQGRFLLHWYLVQGEDTPFHPAPSEVAEIRWVPTRDVPTMPDLLESNRLLAVELGWGAPNHSLAHQLQEHLDQLRQDGLYRAVRTTGSASGRTIQLDGHGQVVNFAGNDYLGLASDPRIRQAVHEAVDRWGFGAGASQLICGHTQLHADLEHAIARFEGTQAALLLPTGYMANLAAVRTLAGPDDVILLDKLNHASIIDAAGSSAATTRVFPHRNYTKLESLLKRYASARRRLIVTDAVFSMDGDLADLPELVRLKDQYDAVLIVDEAHATGVLGDHGCGLAERQGLQGRIDLTVGTLSKALGGIGGFVAGSRVVIDALVNAARPYIFTTAQPAATCAAAMQALQIVREEPWRRQRVLDLAQRLRDNLRAQGWDCGDSETQIVPVMVGSPDRAVALSEQLLTAGFFAPAIRPPAVPPNSARLRLSVTASHTHADVDTFAHALGPAPQ